MKIKAALSAAAIFPALFSLSPSASATTPPTLSGTYALTYIDVCQTTISYTPDGSTGNVKTVNMADGGYFSGTTATATFNGGGSVTLSGGDQDQGDLLILRSGNAMAETPFNPTMTYANDATSFTLTPPSSSPTQFHAVYAQVDNSNIAHYMIFLGIDSAGCFAHGTAVLQ